MAKVTLPVDFLDDILKDTMNGRRRYKMVDNGDGTVSFEDVSEYDQIGSSFGQAQINATNQAVNESVDKAVVVEELADVAAVTEVGFLPGAKAVAELNKNLGGNILTYNESEDAYYIQYGADSAPKKLGNNAMSGTLFNRAYNWDGANAYSTLTFNDIPKGSIITFGSGMSCTVDGASVSSPFTITKELSTVVFSLSQKTSSDASKTVTWSIS